MCAAVPGTGRRGKAGGQGAREGVSEKPEGKTSKQALGALGVQTERRCRWSRAIPWQSAIR